MRPINKLLIICSFLLFVTGCETYKDYEIDYSPVYPLCGEWAVRFTDISVTPNVTSPILTLSTYNTADNSTTQLWIRATSSSTTYMGRFTGKINCNVEGLSFSGENIPNTYYTVAPVPTFTITGGTIIINGYDTATGGKADKITFTMTDTRKAGKSYTVSGFRRTYWPEDEV